MDATEPAADVAAAVAERHFGTPVRVARFPTGSRHFVYAATTVDGRQLVVRLSRPDDVGVAEAALYWSATLRPHGVPLPAVLDADFSMGMVPYPYMLLARLPGVDLGQVVGRLPAAALRAIAAQLVEIQGTVAKLPAVAGYGFTPRLDGPFPHADWAGVVGALLRRGRKRIRAAGVVDETAVDLVEAAVDGFADYFASIPPTPFLHDITTKNVIVDGAQLSGIVDVDDLCVGDPLLLVGLIRTALLANGHSETYAGAWVDALQPDAEQRGALDFYTALFCLDFLAELGHRFNRAAPAAIDPTYVARLQGLLERFLRHA